MNQELKLKRLKLFLRVWGAATILVMSINMSAFVFQIQAFRPGNSMHWLLWDDITGHVGPMIFIIYIVWGFYFFKVAKDPLKHQSFLDFTLWANLFHGLVMVPMALMDATYHLRFLTDIPFILLIAIFLYWLRPTEEEYKTAKSLS